MDPALCDGPAETPLMEMSRETALKSCPVIHWVGHITGKLRTGTFIYLESHPLAAL